MTRLTPALALAAVALIGTAATASAHGHDKPAVCHPTGNGYTLIRPAQASSHIDEAAYPNGHYWKHEHDGRHDVYAVNGACPPIATPTTVPTTATPSPTTTGGTPSATSSTTTSPSPSPTSSTAAPTTTGAGTPSPSESTPPPTHPSTGSQTPSATQPRSRSTSPASPRRSVPSSSVAPPELPRTGSNNGALAALGAVLLAAGTALSRKGARRGQH